MKENQVYILEPIPRYHGGRGAGRRKLSHLPAAAKLNSDMPWF